jgi:two-component system CheB/CheR fusion protein
LARNALFSVSSAPPRSGVLAEGSDRGRDGLGRDGLGRDGLGRDDLGRDARGREAARELQADNEELHETNRQLIAAMEEIQSLNVTLQSVNEALHTTNVELRTDLDQLRTRSGDLERMLNGIDVGVVLLSEGLELRDYNATAARFFALKRQDIGRSIARMRHDFSQTSLPELCRESLDTGEPIERIASASNGDLVSLRVHEVDLGASVSGLLLTVTEITDLGLDPQSRLT